MAKETGTLEVRRLGCVSYNDALLLQQQFVKARRAGEVPDLLLLLQHPHVLTLGAGARHNRGNIVADSAALRAKGIEVVEVGRGGDVTYHGPGQLVGYPIVDLRPDRCDVRRYMRDLEEVMIRTAGTFGVTAERVSGLTGVWVGNAKLGAIGVPGAGAADKALPGPIAIPGTYQVRLTVGETTHLKKFELFQDPKETSVS